MGTYDGMAGQARVQELWRRYVAGGEPFPDEAPDGIRPIIFESWRRSKAAGLSPSRAGDDTLGESELSEALRANRRLAGVAHPYIENLYAFVRGTDFVIALAERGGVVLDLVGLSGKIEERAKGSALKIGCCRSEGAAGACGIGTSLATGEPVQVFGAEHYLEPHHCYVCSAAPVPDEHGDIIGCVAAIGPFEGVSAHTLAMVCAAADGISKELRMRRAYEQISIANKQLSKTLMAISQGVAMIDNSGVITQANDSAKDVLRLYGRELTGENIRDVLDLSSSSFDIFALKKNVSHCEMNVTNAQGMPLSLSVSASVCEDDAGEKVSTVLILEERKQFHKVATKVSGFTAKYNFDQIVGAAESIDEIRKLGKLAAQSDSNVLILGESGTGKDLLAQSIHNASSRRKAPFIAINCGSLPRGLVESELFGYEAGAFTGASAGGTPGKFELADGGTLFLDEIGDMPLEIQATLLRAIQTKEILRIGGKSAKRVDVRVIAATNVNLAERIENRLFRKDLYYRLNVLTFRMPALRERKEDLPLLIDTFMDIYNARIGKGVRGLTDTAMRYVAAYDWPGNIRELENMVERAVNLAEGAFITERDLGPEIVRGIGAGGAGSAGDAFGFGGVGSGGAFGFGGAGSGGAFGFGGVGSGGPFGFGGIGSGGAFGLGGAGSGGAFGLGGAGSGGAFGLGGAGIPFDEAPAPPPGAGGLRASPHHEEMLIREALIRARGNVTKAARIAAIPKRTLYRRIELLGIDLAEFRGAES